jgi:hypothetical protein
MEDRVRAHALTVIAQARIRLGEARAAAESARKRFNEGVGWLYWNTIDETLRRNRSVGPHYTEFINALKELDAAVEKARAASDRLMHATATQERKS